MYDLDVRAKFRVVLCFYFVSLLFFFFDFKIKTLIRYKESHYMMIKGSVQEGDITFINYADSSRPYGL